MLDVWDGEEDQLEQALKSRQIEYGGELGIIEQQGWYTQETILKENPNTEIFQPINHNHYR